MIMRLLAALLTCLAALTGLPARSAAQADSALRFPLVEGSNLEGRKFTLPAEFDGELNVVFVAFKREQQADVETWVPFVKGAVARHAALHVYEVPTLGRNFRFIRRLIDGGMARGIPDKATRETTITLYIDKAPFERALGITTEDVIRVLLVARGGRILWSGDGVYSAESAALLTAAIDAHS